MYDTNNDGSPNKNSVTLGGDGGTVIHNVAAGVDATDAVNLGQMEAAISGAIQNIAPGAASPFFSANGDTSTEAAQSSGTYAVAAGANAQASGTNAVAVGANSVASGSAVGQANSYTDDQIRSARRDSYGGTASALAAAGLPQAVLPGHGMVAIAGGTYAGQSAVAIGVSQLSETGKWVYKVQGTSDSRGQFGASIGAGMHW
jgi:autotransporter adhesin